MNFEDEANQFQVGLKRLVGDVTQDLTSASLGSIGATPGKHRVLERTTRAWFHDKLLELLGWDLGIRGNVAQEARVKRDTMYFIDYVGMSTQRPPAPVLLFESKPWGSPWIAARTAESSYSSPSDLIVAGLQHIARGGSKNTSPVIGLWHDHLEQASRYANAVHEAGEHGLCRLVLSSGDWMVVFTKPASTFVEAGIVDGSHFEIFKVVGYVEQGRRIFELLSQCSLINQIPFALRVGQLGSYLKKTEEHRVFHAVHVAYEVSGSELFARVPRVLVYAAIAFQRNNGTTVAVVDGRAEELPASVDGSTRKIEEHLATVASYASELLDSCSDEMGSELKPVELSEFGGFLSDESQEGDDGKRVVKPLKKAPDEWLFVTGRRTHFLRPRPIVDPCSFHGWHEARARGNGIGSGAVNTPSVQGTRVFFVDGDPHHCAHQLVVDRREVKCQIAALDRRVCCRACEYETVCWSDDEIMALPCGS